MQPLFSDIYKGKTVLVTGHTGFKGSWLSLWLTELGAIVIGYSKDIPTRPNHFELLKLPIESIEGDIRDGKKFQETLEKYRPDIVFHMAAQALVRDSYVTPVETFDTNVMGTVHVLEACRTASSVKAIVNITSDKCYQNNEWERGYVETDAMGGYDPYSASKGCAELVANSYRNSFFNPKDYGTTHTTLLADVRAGNVIGGGDWAKDRLIPDIMRSTSKGETVLIRNPRATRPWQHVLEPLSGYLHIGCRLLAGEVVYADNWNFGPKDESSLTVSQVANYAQKYWDSITFKVEENPQNVHEAHLLKLDSSKARIQLGWESVWNADATFQKTIEWYKCYYADNQIVSREDLAAYIQDAQNANLAWTL